MENGLHLTYRREGLNFNVQSCLHKGVRPILRCGAFIDKWGDSGIIVLRNASGIG